jgi:hypothetical protein
MSAPNSPASGQDGLDRFLSGGARDVRRRLPFLARVERSDEQAVIKVMIESVVVSWLNRLVTSTSRAWTTSTVVSGLRRAWMTLIPMERRLLIGLTLIVAAVVHVSLVLWSEQPPAWHWLLLPTFAAAAGALCLVFARSQPGERG